MTRKSSARNADGWTDKERLFAHEYLIDKNKTAAAIRAGYSAKTAKGTGHEISLRPHIKAWIDEHLEQKCKELDITVERVLQEVAKMAFMDPRKFFNADGSLKDISSLDDNTAACLAGLEIATRHDEDGNQHSLAKVKLTSKKDNLELLGRNLKMWTDKIEVSDRPLVYVKDMTGRKKKAEAAE